MSFDQYESSRAHGERIFLYHFFYIGNSEFHYTNSEFPIERVMQNATYRPIPITHGALTSTGSLDKAQIDIRMSVRAELAEAFRVYPPSNVVNVIIRQMQKGDPAEEALVCWAGRVISSGRTDNEMTLTCEPISTSLRRTGLRRHYQLGCPHVLYGKQCAASRAAGTVSDVTVTSVDGSNIQVEPAWLPTDWPAAKRKPEKFVGGIVSWTYDTPQGPVEEKRTVLRVTGGAAFALTGPATGLTAGGKVNLIIGCNHQLSDCKQVHQNSRNFGGQHLIPQKNPFGFTNQFY